MRAFLLAAALALSASSAKSEVITHDIGGRIGDYLQRYDALARSGKQIVIDGECLSACTLVLRLVRTGKVCATERARLGFHAAWLPDSNGRPVTNELGTELLINNYPSKVNLWLASGGGLGRNMRYEKATRFVPRCTPAKLQAARSSASGTYARAGN